MRVYKKLSLICMSMLLAFSFLISSFPLNTKKSKHSANAKDEIQLIDSTVLNYVTLTIAGKTLTTDNIKSIDTDNDGKVDTSYIITKGTITLTFKPFEYNYSIDSETFDSSLYTKGTPIESNLLEKDEATGNFPSSFIANETLYNYQIASDDKLSITSSGSRYAIGQSDFINMVETETTRKFEFTTSYILNFEQDSSKSETSFVFSVNNSNTATQTTTYSLNFVKPVLDFSESESIVSFTCTGLDIGDTPYQTDDIQDELSYESVVLEFNNNNYTEINPLYFNINHNGFIYTFKLYSEGEYLFVEYYDDQRQGSNSDTNKNNNKSLATTLKSNGDIDVPVYKFLDGTTNPNKFSICFDTTGRYEIEIYDSTYLLLKNQPTIIENIITKEDGTKETQTIVEEPEDNSINYNYRSASFYIKTKESDGNTSSAYDNAYAIMQSYDDEDNFLDYIVSDSTQNNNVQVTLKNLSYYFEKDEFISSQTEETLKELSIVEVTKATLPGSSNLPETTYYTVGDLKELFAQQTGNDKVLTINCTEDAVYEIVINRYTYDSNTGHKKISDDNHKYQFTVVKQPRTFYTVTNVDEYNDPTEINGEKTTLYYADTPYVTKPITYKININANITLKFSFDSNNNHNYDEKELSKTYLNEYTINYAMQSVKIEQIEFGDNDDNKGKLGLRFYGVGEINVNITVNSLTTTYSVNSGETLIFETYGTYSIAIEDSMGTVGTEIINFSKPTNTSAVILIVLVGIIVLAIVLFIISSRGRLKTR